MTHDLTNGEAALWRAVVLQAFQDATLGRHCASTLRKLGAPSAERQAHARAAREWLSEDSGYFRRVCDLAGLDANAVRASAAVAIACADQSLREFESKQAFLGLQRHDSRESIS